MAEEKICGVYCIENMINGKKYVGLSKDITNRWKIHKSSLKKNSHHNNHLQRSWNIHGEENFTFYVLEEGDYNDIGDLEIYYINKFNSLDDKFGYNITTGGIKYSFSDKYCEELSKIKTKIEGRPIISINIWAGEVQELEGLRRICRKSNLDQSTILDVLRGRRTTAYERIWVYRDLLNNSIDFKQYLDSSSTPRRVLQYDKNGNFINEFKFANKVKEHGFDPSCVLKCCKGKYDAHKGYIWKYKPWFNGEDNVNIEMILK